MVRLEERLLHLTKGKCYVLFCIFHGLSYLAPRGTIAVVFSFAFSLLYHQDVLSAGLCQISAPPIRANTHVLFRPLHTSLDMHVLDRTGEGEDQQQKEGFYQESLLPPTPALSLQTSPTGMTTALWEALGMQQRGDIESSRHQFV